MDGGRTRVILVSTTRCKVSREDADRLCTIVLVSINGAHKFQGKRQEEWQSK